MKGIHIFLFSIVGCAMHGHSQEGTKQNFVSKPFLIDVQ
jgi:hypothetical protein